MSDVIEILGTDYLSDSRTDLNDNFTAVRTRFAGATAPTAPQAYDLWADTGTGYEKERNAANDAWIVMRKIGTVNGGLLALTGGTMSGPIDMGTQILSNLGLGTGLAAARVQEVDLKAPIAAPTFTGDAKVSQDPAGNDSIPRRSWTEARYLKLTGGTLTGAVVLSGVATADLNPAGFKQVKDLVAFNTTSGHRHDGSDARKVKATSLDSESAPSNAVLRASGAGATAWSTLPANYMTMLEGRQLLVSRTSSIGWTTLDISAYVPAGAIAAFLHVTYDTVTGSADVGLRKTGTTPASPQICKVDVCDFQTLSTFVNCVDRQFDYYVSISGSATVIVYLLGYIENI